MTSVRRRLGGAHRPATVDDVTRQLDRAAARAVARPDPPRRSASSSSRAAAAPYPAAQRARAGLDPQRRARHRPAGYPHADRGRPARPAPGAGHVRQPAAAVADVRPGDHLERRGPRSGGHPLRDLGARPGARDGVGSDRDQLQLGSNDRVVAIRRVRSVDGAPMYALDNYVVAHRCPGLEATDLTDATAVHRARGGLSRGRRRHPAHVPGPDRHAGRRRAAADRAGQPRALPRAGLVRRGLAPIEYSDVWIRGDRLRLSAWLRR